MLWAIIVFMTRFALSARLQCCVYSDVRWCWMCSLVRSHVNSLLVNCVRRLRRWLVDIHTSDTFGLLGPWWRFDLWLSTFQRVPPTYCNGLLVARYVRSLTLAGIQLNRWPPSPMVARRMWHALSLLYFVVGSWTFDNLGNFTHIRCPLSTCRPVKILRQVGKSFCGV